MTRHLFVSLLDFPLTTPSFPTVHNVDDEHLTVVSVGGSPYLRAAEVRAEAAIPQTPFDSESMVPVVRARARARVCVCVCVLSLIHI